MAASTSIGQQHHHLERLRLGWSKVLATIVGAVMVAACSHAASTVVTPDLSAFVPQNAKVTASSDRKSATGRTASANLTLDGSADDYVKAFKASARAQGYEEQVDQTSAAARVVAYRAAGDKTITLTLTTEGAEKPTAAIVLSSP